MTDDDENFFPRRRISSYFSSLTILFLPPICPLISFLHFHFVTFSPNRFYYYPLLTIIFSFPETFRGPFVSLIKLSSNNLRASTRVDRFSSSIKHAWPTNCVSIGYTYLVSVARSSVLGGYILRSLSTPLGYILATKSRECSL